jgi:hypothetical protein
MLTAILIMLGLLGCCAIGMTITQLENRIGATHLLHHYVAAPAATTLQTVGASVDMQAWKCFMASYLKSTGTGLLSTFQLIAGDTANFSGNNVTIFTDAWPVVQPAAAGNQVFLECTAQQIAQLAATSGFALRYVGVQYQQATSGDTGVVTFLATEPTFAYPGLTSDATS